MNAGLTSIPRTPGATPRSVGPQRLIAAARAPLAPASAWGRIEACGCTTWVTWPFYFCQGPGQTSLSHGLSGGPRSGLLEGPPEALLTIRNHIVFLSANALRFRTKHHCTSPSRALLARYTIMTIKFLVITLLPALGLSGRVIHRCTYTAVHLASHVGPPSPKGTTTYERQTNESASAPKLPHCYQAAARVPLDRKGGCRLPEALA